MLELEYHAARDCAVWVPWSTWRASGCDAPMYGSICTHHATCCKVNFSSSLSASELIHSTGLAVGASRHSQSCRR